MKSVYKCLLSFSRKSSPRKTSSSGWNVKNSRNSPTPNRSFLSPPLPSHPSLSLSLVVQIRVKANAIWKTYLQDTDDGSCRINIDSRTRQECQQALLSSHPTEQLFEKAQSQIFQLMKYDSYSRFLKSHMYKECRNNSLPKATEERVQQQAPTVGLSPCICSFIPLLVCSVPRWKRKRRNARVFFLGQKVRVLNKCSSSSRERLFFGLQRLPNGNVRSFQVSWK